MRVFHSKHQKLILQCYPPGKAVDKKPNPLELSYLLYYASTRRVKLEKVIDFLDRKTKLDARGNKSGNLHVTLAIVAALINKCADNLNAFALQVCSILQSVWNTGELPLCKSAVKTYGVFCEKLDGGLFSGDKAFVATFTALSDSMIALGVSQLSNGPNQRDWKYVALVTARHVFNCIRFNAGVSRRFLNTCVPLLTSTVRSLSLHDALLTRLRSNLNVEKDDRRMSRVLTAAVHLVRVTDEDALSDADLNEEALLGLKTLFNTLLLSQIMEATVAVVESNFRSGCDDAWAVTFLEMCASWIPVQLRFVSLLTLLHHLTAMSDHMEDLKSYDRMVHFASSILGLVSLDFNMIGLSITDILQQLLTLQTNLFVVQAEALSPDQVAHLSDIYSQSICSLLSHIYYFDQVPDSVVAILLQIDTVLLSTGPSKPAAVQTLVVVLLDTVLTILSILSRKMSNISRNHATLENWELSFLLLLVSKSYKEYAAAATPEHIVAIQSKYLTVFSEFLNAEMVQEASDDDAATADKYLTPNYHLYIENPDNAMAHLLVHCNEFFEEPIVDLSVVRLLFDALRTLVGITGVNFVHNFLPFFQHWQLQSATNNFADCVKDTIAYLLLSELLTVLTKCDADVAKLKLQEHIDYDIQDRRNRAVWVEGLDETINTDTIVTGQLLSTRVNKKSLYEFFTQTSLQKWLSTLRAFQADESDILNGNIDTETFKSDEHLEDSQMPVNGYGLGSANDISSIHSGLLHSNRNGHVSPDATHITAETLPSIGSTYVYDANNYKLPPMPRVSDLKRTVSGKQTQEDLFSFTNERTTPRSVLQRQILTTDVGSILDNLVSEDDNEIVV